MWRVLGWYNCDKCIAFNLEILIFKLDKYTLFILRKVSLIYVWRVLEWYNCDNDDSLLTEMTPDRCRTRTILETIIILKQLWSSTSWLSVFSIIWVYCIASVCGTFVISCLEFPEDISLGVSEGNITVDIERHTSITAITRLDIKPLLCICIYIITICICSLYPETAQVS